MRELFCILPFYLFVASSSTDLYIFFYSLVRGWSRVKWNEWARVVRSGHRVRGDGRDRTVLIKILARERNVDVCHPGTGVLPPLPLLALTISSLASRSVARGDGITSITNANRLRRRRRQAWYLYLRVRSCTPRSHGGGRLSNHFMLLLECKLLSVSFFLARLRSTGADA